MFAMLIAATNVTSLILSLGKRGREQGGQEQQFRGACDSGEVLAAVGLPVLMLVVEARPAEATFRGKPGNRVLYRRVCEVSVRALRGLDYLRYFPGYAVRQYFHRRAVRVPGVASLGVPAIAHRCFG